LGARRSFWSVRKCVSAAAERGAGNHREGKQNKEIAPQLSKLL
jgi:hypothetical protein